MFRIFWLLTLLCLLSGAPAWAQVQTVGAVSFAVPPGWTYQQGRDYGAMSLKTTDRFWLVAVYTDMPTSGNADNDFKTAWTRVVLGGPGYRGVPRYSPYSITGTVGYPGKYYDDTSIDQRTYTRLYILETGKTFVPVAYVSLNRGVLDSMEHNALAIVGSVRVAPLRAAAIRYSISVADLEGQWKDGIATSINYYSDAGQYKGNSLTALNIGYTIARDGSYRYKYGGVMNNHAISGDDTGVVEVGGDFVTLKGQKYKTRYRFILLEQAIDGSSVAMFWPDIDPSKINSNRDSVYWTRAKK